MRKSKKQLISESFFSEIPEIPDHSNMDIRGVFIL
jgi:hypothetical protein